MTGAMKLNSYFQIKNSCVNVKSMHDVLHQQVCATWNQYNFNVDKLRTYVTFNQKYGIEHYYVKIVTNRQHRTVLSQFRCGLLLKVKTRRFQDISVEYRLCTMCEDNVIETESYVFLYCYKYNQLRYHFLVT